MVNVHGVWLWSMYMECGYGQCTWSVAMVNVHGVWLWSMYMDSLSPVSSGNMYVFELDFKTGDFPDTRGYTHCPHCMKADGLSVRDEGRCV